MNKRTKIMFILVLVSVALNLGLALTKLFVGLRTNSLCIMLDSVNGFLDTATCTVAAILVGVSAISATERHPYGFGRNEYVSGLVVSVAAILFGAIFLYDSFGRLSLPEPVWFGRNSFITIVCTVPVKAIMATVFLIFSKKVSSKVLKAFAVDCFLDVGVTTATIVSFVLSQKLRYAVDAWFGIAISAAVIVCAVFMIRDNLRALVSGDVEEERASVMRVCRADADVLEILDLQIHDYGFGAKYGTAEITIRTAADGDAVEKRLAERVAADSDAHMRFYVKRKK